MIIERIASAASANTSFPANTALNAGDAFPAAGKGNDQLVSPNGKFILVAGTNANSGMFCTFNRDIAKPFAQGVQNATACIGKPNYPNARMVLQADGNLVILTDHIIWAYSTVPSGDPRFNDATLKPVKVGVGNDGAIKLYNEKGEEVWYDNSN